MREAYEWAETIRQHYMSLEGAGPRKIKEATFFLEWHYEMCGGLRTRRDVWVNA